MTREGEREGVWGERRPTAVWPGFCRSHLLGHLVGGICGGGLGKKGGREGVRREGGREGYALLFCERTSKRPSCTRAAIVRKIIFSGLVLVACVVGHGAGMRPQGGGREGGLGYDVPGQAVLEAKRKRSSSG